MPDDLTTDQALARRAIRLIDLTDLADDTDEGSADALCARAVRAGVAAVCVWPRFVARCARQLDGSGVRVATVVNFPAGTDPPDAVGAMTATALTDGADEIDVVLPYGAWLGGDLDRAAAVLGVVRTEAGSRTVKVIIETGELPDRAAIDRAAHFAIANGADFVKTSTGKTSVSATPEAAEIVLEAIEVSGRPVGFKASGGIRTLGDAASYLELADRIMGPEWATPDTFRFGASGLLDALEAVSRSA
ncbi:MAG: deoxyribose-phosphate aldolase [Ilumatobacteraceae bacterium]